MVEAEELQVTYTHTINLALPLWLQKGPLVQPGTLQMRGGHATRQDHNFGGEPALTIHHKFSRAVVVNLYSCLQLHTFVLEYFSFPISIHHLFGSDQQ